MNAHDRIRLRHMLEAAAQACRLAESRSRDHLDADPALVLAITKAVEIVGEAARRVSDRTRRELSAFPWTPLIHMRHRLVHDYYRINLDILWQTVVEDLPPSFGSWNQRCASLRRRP